MKDPAFLFYTGDFSTGTQFFTDEQLGKYLRLLMAQHQHGHLTEKQMMHICKSYDNDVFIKFIKDDNGMFFNERLEREILKRKNYSISRSNNKSGRKSTKNKDLLKVNEESYDNHMENKNKDINKEENKNHLEICLKILSDFKFNQIKNQDKLRKISEFINRLQFDKRFDWFIEQYKSYWNYKNISGQEKQSLETFIDGGWDRQNWTEKLKEYNNGTTSTKQSEQERRKQDRAALGDAAEKVLNAVGLSINRSRDT